MVRPSGRQRRGCLPTPAWVRPSGRQRQIGAKQGFGKPGFGLQAGCSSSLEKQGQGIRMPDQDGAGAVTDVPVWLVTFATYRRKPVFANPVLRERCADAVLETTTRNGYRVYALAIMPDHVHLVMDAGSADHAASKIINNLKGVVSRRVFQAYPELKVDLASNHLWTIEYQAKLLPALAAVRQACRYVQQNPIEAGLVSQIYSWITPLS
jgi:REP element-mobilizing transposase RayT